MKQTRNGQSGAPVFDAVLEDLTGPLVVLGPKLQILWASHSAIKLAGHDLPLGASAPKLLCGGATNRPIADALARGQAVTGLLKRPGKTATGDRVIRVTAHPVTDHSAPIGWLLLLQETETKNEGEAILFSGLWTRSAEMKRVFHIVERAAQSDATVLLRGETGTGKELLARALHDRSKRHRGPFVAINCAAVPASLLESELFGHVRGAFTGAHRDQLGLFRSAHRGTVFLDEIGEMPVELQSKLLRALETRSVTPVGGREPIAVDVRVVAATHQSLRKAVADGRFRADLMYRLRVVPIFLPSLAQRKTDVGLLSEKMIADLNAQGGRQIQKISPSALLALESYDWPGNVRELRNAFEYAYVVGTGPLLQLGDLPMEIAQPENESGETPSTEHANNPELARLTRAIERAGGHRERAAQMLGISRATLWRKMREYNLLDA